MKSLTAAPVASLRRMPKGIWALGFVSLLMDVSSELILSLLPVFMAGTLGLSMLSIGMIEGAAEATALIVKVFSGVLSDYFGRRKPMAVLGYGLGALSKPVFAMATSAGWVIGARLADRIGKGIRGAPRDALVAELSPPDMLGAAFGLRQSLDTVGAFLGPMLAVTFMLLWHDDVRSVFWVATVPAVLCVALLVLGVKEPDRPPATRRSNPINRANLMRLGADYWWVVGVGAVFTLARFSEAFLVLRGQQGGLALAWTPLVLMGMSLVFAVGAYPLGKLSDRTSQSGLLALGLVALMAADLLLAFNSQGLGFWVGVALWGLHMAMTQGLLAAMVASTCPADLRGTAFGFFNLLSGLAMLLASVIAGGLWQVWGATVTFMAGSGFAAAVLALLALRPGVRRRVWPK